MNRPHPAAGLVNRAWHLRVPLALMILGGSFACDVTNVTVIQDVTVVDVAAGTLAPSMTIIVSGNRIRDIGPADQLRVPRGATVVNGAGKFAIPGLWDMHVHVLQDGVYQRTFPMLIANGVTGVRDMNGPMPLDEIHALRDRVAAGEVLGPRFIAPGPLLDGPGRGPGALGPMVRWVDTPEKARDSVRALAAQGADFIKTYNRLTRELYDAVLDEAALAALPVMGHVPLGVSPLHASERGQRSMEHAQGLMEAVASGGEVYQAAITEYGELLAAGEQPGLPLIMSVLNGRKAAVGTRDSSRTAQFFEAFVRNGNWQTVTLVSNRIVHFADLDNDFAQDPRLRFIPEAARAQMAEASFTRAFGNPGEAVMRQRWRELLSLVGEMQRAGVPILAGTDAGAAYTYAGFSLHDELGLLVEAGLSPQAALYAATAGPAEFLGAADSLGTLGPGKVADIVLLDGNPLRDITNTSRVWAVVANGRMLRRGDLDALLVRAEAFARSAAATAGAIN